MAQLSIALYAPMDAIGGDYHWALVVSDGVPFDPVDLFQIRNDIPSDQLGASGGTSQEWRLDNRTAVDLSQSSQLIGCVLLQTSSTSSVAYLCKHSLKYPPEKPDHYTPPKDASERWSCVHYVLRILYDMRTQGLVNFDPDKIVTRTIAKGMLLKNNYGNYYGGVQTIEL